MPKYRVDTDRGSYIVETEEPSVPGMEKLGALPAAGQAPAGVVQPIHPQTRIPSESNLESGSRMAYLAKYGMEPPDSLGTGTPGMGPEGLAPAALSTPGALFTSAVAGYGGYKGAKALGLPEPLADVAALGTSMLTGGLYGRFLPELIPSSLSPRATAALNVVPGDIGTRFNRYLAAIKGIPEPRPNVPPPPFMKQATEVLPEEPAVPPPPLMRQKTVIEKAPKAPKRVPAPPLQGSSAARTAESAEPAAIPPPPAAPSTVESPIPATAGTFKHSAAHTDLMRQIHAVGKELELPGSPAGKDAHAIISETAKKLYGVKSLSELSYEQLQNLNEHLLKHKALPTIPQPPQ